MARMINCDEKCTEKWLVEQGYVTIRQRNDPPDFVVNNSCAVEIVRLSRKIHFAGRHNSTSPKTDFVSEEEKRIPLTDTINGVLNEINEKYASSVNRCWIVDVEYDLSDTQWFMHCEKHIVKKEISRALMLLLQPNGDSVFDEHSRHLGIDTGKLREIKDFRNEQQKCIYLTCGLFLTLTELKYNQWDIFILQNISPDSGHVPTDELKKHSICSKGHLY